MKKKEIQAEIREKINQLINELHTIPDDVIKKESRLIKTALEDNNTLEYCLIVCIKDLTSTAIDSINNT